MGGGRKEGRKEGKKERKKEREKERKTTEAKVCEMQPNFYYGNLNALVISC